MCCCPVSLVDQAYGSAPLIVLMEHTDLNGKPNIVKKVDQQVTGRNCISKLITDLAVFEMRDGKFVMTEIAPEISVNELRAKTEGKFEVEPNFRRMP